MITLIARNLQWIAEKDVDDQCAHSEIEFRVNNTDFVKREDGVLAVSGACLYLLRTLERSHTPEKTVAKTNVLFPHCAYSAWLVDGEVMCVGCNPELGVDLKVIHKNGDILIEGKNNVVETVSMDEWRAAIFALVDQVEAFYKQSKPKVPPDDKFDRDGWAAFWGEWKVRREVVDPQKHIPTGNG